MRAREAVVIRDLTLRERNRDGDSTPKRPNLPGHETCHFVGLSRFLMALILMELCSMDLQIRALSGRKDLVAAEIMSDPLRPAEVD